MAVLKVLLQFLAIQVVLNGAVVLAVEAEPMDHLAIVVAADQFLAVVAAVAAVISRVAFLDAALPEVRQHTLAIQV